MANCMIDSCIADIKGFLVSPADTFRKAKEKTLGAAFQYYTVLLVIFTILLAIVTVSMGIAHFSQTAGNLATVPGIGALISGGMEKFSGFIVAWEVFAVYLLFLIMLFGIFLSGLYYHVFVLLMGGKNGVTQSMKTVMYASTPFLLLGWIPYVNIIGAIWYLVLLIIGFEQTQDLSIGKAILVILIPIVLMIILVSLGAIVILSFISGIFSLIPTRF